MTHDIFTDEAVSTLPKLKGPNGIVFSPSSVEEEVDRYLLDFFNESGGHIGLTFLHSDIEQGLFAGHPSYFWEEYAEAADLVGIEIDDPEDGEWKGRAFYEHFSSEFYRIASRLEALIKAGRADLNSARDEAEFVGFSIRHHEGWTETEGGARLARALGELSFRIAEEVAVLPLVINMELDQDDNFSVALDSTARETLYDFEYYNFRTRQLFAGSSFVDEAIDMFKRFSDEIWEEIPYEATLPDAGGSYVGVNP